jgi:peptidoglycan/xylan/chitin deacetylase (PgdA/CDA1 family)
MNLFDRRFLTNTVTASCVLLLVTGALIPLSACGGGAAGSSLDPPQSASLATISFLPASATIPVGSTQQFQATAEDQNGRVMTGVTFAFSSSNSAASVDSRGIAKGISPGAATIIVSANGKTAIASLTVTPASRPTAVLTKISVSPSTASIQVGERTTFTATGYDQFNNVMTGITFTWGSNDEGSIATINAGLATGLSSGTAQITASASGVSSAPASLMVLPPPPVLTSIAVTPATPSIFVGGVQQFTALGYDQNGNPMTGVSFAWSSSNRTVATVDMGLAKGLSPGSTHITASAQGVTSNGAILTISKAPSVLTSMVVSPSSASIQAGETQQFTVTGFDQYNSAMSGITFAWSSSNTDAATVSSINSEGVSAGLAKGMAAGSTQITASAQGITSNPVALTVTAPPPPPPPPVVTTINVMPASGSIQVGVTQQFVAYASDQNGSAMSGISFSWTSSGPSVVIDANGLAKGISPGTAQISASANGVSGSASLTVVMPPPPNPITITRLSPPIALVGSGDLDSLIITGTGFISGAVVNFGSNVLIPSSISPTSMLVKVPAADLTSASNVNVSVSDPVPNAGTSNAMQFTITNSGFVSINFDDGYQSMYDNGLPIFDAAGLRTSQYLITQQVGTDGYVTWDEVHTMVNHGHEIGNHTRTHPFLTSLPLTQVQGEIIGAQQDFQAQGITPLTVAYPYGDYNTAVENIVKAGGFRGARSSDSGYDCNLLFTLPSACHNGVFSNNPLFLYSEAAEADMNTTIDDITGWIDYASANKLWLIILLHRVDEDGNPISVSHQLLQQMVDYLVQHQIYVVTNSEGMIIENFNAQN